MRTFAQHASSAILNLRLSDVLSDARETEVIGKGAVLIGTGCGETAFVRFRDNGCGMTEEFQRGRRTTRCSDADGRAFSLTIRSYGENNGKAAGHR